MDKGLLVIRLLQVKLNTISSLRKLTKNNINFCEWKEQSIELLEKIDCDEKLLKEFKAIKYCPQKHPYQTEQLDLQDIQSNYQCGLDKAQEILKLVIISYSSKYLEQKTVGGINANDIVALIDDSKLSATEKVELKEKVENIYNIPNNKVFNNQSNELENNTIAAIYNKITPKAISL